MKEINDKKGHGGKRAGAGRPKTSFKTYSFKADEEISNMIESQQNKTQFIQDCIRTTVNLQQMPTDNPDFSKFGEVIPAGRMMEAHIPFFDIKLVAGFPIPLDNTEISQDIDLLRMLCPHPDASYLVKIQGNSMIESGIHDGDMIIVDKSQRNPDKNQIAVCELNGEYTVKRVQQINGKRYLVPANPEFPMMEIMEGDSFSVWGVVTFIINKPK